MLLLALLCILGFLVLYRTLRRQQLRKSEALHKSSPPKRYRHRDPFGLDLFLKTGRDFREDRVLDGIVENYGVYGNTFATTFFGRTDIHSCEPENIKKVFSTDSRAWGVFHRRQGFDNFIGRGFLTTDNAEWEHHRAYIKPSFSKAKIWNHTVYEGFFSSLLERLPADGSTTDLQDLINKLYADSSSHFLLGRSFGVSSTKTASEYERYEDSANYAFMACALRNQLGLVGGLLYDPRLSRSIKYVHGYLDKFIDQAVIDEKQSSHPKSPGHFCMLNAMVEQGSDRTEIRSNIIHGLLATLDTTAFLISNVFWLLARHPEEWAELRSQVREKLGSESSLTFDDATKIPLIGNIINETLRLYPVFSFQVRTALEDCVLPVGGGPKGQQTIFVPKGSQFSADFTVLHRRKDIYGDDADEWRPGRWPELAGKLQPWQYLAFGGGSRVCLGKTKAVAEASYFICRMAQEFDGIEPRDERPWKGRVKTSTSNAHGCLIGLTPRKR